MEDTTACILYFFLISLRVAFTSWEFLCQLLCMWHAAEAGIKIVLLSTFGSTLATSSLNALLCHVVNHKSTWTIPWLDKTEIVQGDQTVMNPERCVNSTSLENSHFLRKLFASLCLLGYQELHRTVSGHFKLPALFTILSPRLLHHFTSFWLEQWCIYAAKKPYLMGGGRI